MSELRKGIILLSGGLDSVVSLAVMAKTTDFILALTFDYGQKSAVKEIKASEKIAQYYNIQHKVIKLDWLKKITNTSLVSERVVPEMTEEDLEDTEKSHQSCENVWVPNRNGLFINIAACYADSMGADIIVIGANKEEAVTFTDNSKDFIEYINLSLSKSAMQNVKAEAPLIDMVKEEIIQKGIDEEAPLELINSCYNSDGKHCAHCESCTRLKRALQRLGQADLINKLF